VGSIESVSAAGEGGDVANCGSIVCNVANCGSSVAHTADGSTVTDAATNTNTGSTATPAEVIVGCCIVRVVVKQI
jgi:hypothetical protein